MKGDIQASAMENSLHLISVVTRNGSIIPRPRNNQLKAWLIKGVLRFVAAISAVCRIINTDTASINIWKLNIKNNFLLANCFDANFFTMKQATAIANNPPKTTKLKLSSRVPVGIAGKKATVRHDTDHCINIRFSISSFLNIHGHAAKQTIPSDITSR